MQRKQCRKTGDAAEAARNDCGDAAEAARNDRNTAEMLPKRCGKTTGAVRT